MSDLVGRAVAAVDVDAITENISTVCEVADQAAVMAVVKANAYGHGLTKSAAAALAGGATWLGVATIDEALTLRDAGFSVPIVVFIVTAVDRIDECIKSGIHLTLGGPAVLQAVTEAVRRLGVSARIHLEVDTGMGRGGCPIENWSSFAADIAAAQRQRLIRLIGIWSQLACADLDRHPSVPIQVTAFEQALKTARRAGLNPEVVHLANSAATIAYSKTRFDLVRAGLLTYGVSPAPHLGEAGDLGLTPAMTLKSVVTETKNLPAGHGISYGHDVVTTRPTRTAVVPVGYADGIARSGVGLWLTIDGMRYPVIGRVCMDQVIVDVTSGVVSAGEVVTVFGTGDSGEPTVTEWATACGTIPNEVLTRVGQRVTRDYVRRESHL